MHLPLLAGMPTPTFPCLRARCCQFPYFIHEAKPGTQRGTLASQDLTVLQYSTLFFLSLFQKQTKDTENTAHKIERQNKKEAGKDQNIYMKAKRRRKE